MVEKNKVCILGMGYVGLTLGLVLCERGFSVTGVDVDDKSVDAINAKKPRINEDGLIPLLEKHLGKNLVVTTSMPKEKQDICILAVGTPVDIASKSIIYDYIYAASKQLKNIIKNDSLIILRSTVSVGATRTVVKPHLDETGMKYKLAFCPERTIQGKAIKELSELPQIIGGLDTESTDAAAEFFKKITPNIVCVSSLEAAELIKKINNSYRDLTFSFANDVAELCEKAGLNAYEVISKSNEGYKRSSIPLPGFVGGYCLTKDPYILLGLANKYGIKMNTVLHARLVNESLPLKSAERIHLIAKKLNMKPDKIKIFITGFAFKGIPDTDDIRGSPTIFILDALLAKGYKNIYGHDYVVGKDKLEFLNIKVCSFEDGLKDADVVIIANNNMRYENVDVEKLWIKKNIEKPLILFDAWGIYRNKDYKKYKNLSYFAIGISDNYKN